MLISLSQYTLQPRHHPINAIPLLADRLPRPPFDFSYPGLLFFLFSRHSIYFVMPAATAMVTGPSPGDWRGDELFFK